MWHGGKTDTSADWISMRVPEGEDWLEYMCNVQNLTPKTRGIMNHVAFGVPEMDAAAKILQSRQAPMPEKPKIGRDGKWQLNLYDPNLTRAELMEPKPVETPCCSELKPHRGPEGAVGIFTNQGPVGDATAGSKAEFDTEKQEYRITGGGANVWDTTDAFYFIWTRMAGDLSLTADVTWSGTSPVEHRKAMLMVRDGLASGAAYAVRHRTATDSRRCSSVAWRMKAPTRRSSISTAAASASSAKGSLRCTPAKPAGVKTVGPVEYVRIKDPAYVGLGVSSHVATTSRDRGVLEREIGAVEKVGLRRPVYTRPEGGSTFRETTCNGRLHRDRHSWRHARQSSVEADHWQQRAVRKQSQLYTTAGRKADLDLLSHLVRARHVFAARRALHARWHHSAWARMTQPSYTDADLDIGGLAVPRATTLYVEKSTRELEAYCQQQLADARGRPQWGINRDGSTTNSPTTGGRAALTMGKPASPINA